MSDVGYLHRWGVNGMVAFKEPEVAYNESFEKTMHGLFVLITVLQRSIKRWIDGLVELLVL